jgi:hypothetical protein
MQVTAVEFRTEFVLLVIMLIGALVAFPGEPSHSKVKTGGVQFGLPVALLILVSFLLGWGRIITRWPMKFPTPIQALLWIDLGVAVILVISSGGTVASCCSPLYFTLPTFAIQLGQKGEFLLWYVVAIVGCFLATLRPPRPTAAGLNWSFRDPNDVHADCERIDRKNRWLLASYAVVAVMCFLLTFAIPTIISTP